MSTECSKNVAGSFKFNKWRTQRDTFNTHVQGVKDELQTLQTICVLSGNVSQKQCSISFMIALTQFRPGKIMYYITYL